MAAGTYDLTIEQGVTYNLTLTLYSDEAKTTPIDLSSHTILMQLREAKDSPETIISLTLTSGLSVTGVSSNIINVLMTAAQTALFNFDKAYYDIELSLGGVVSRLMEGTVTLSKEVTR